MKPGKPEPLPLAFGEQDCQVLLAELVKHEHLSKLHTTLKVKNTSGSYVDRVNNTITISKRGLEKNYYYGKALVIHEFSHIVTHHKNGYGAKVHGKEFKRIEDRLLKLFGLSIKRARAYATIIYYEGKEVWHK